MKHLDDLYTTLLQRYSPSTERQAHAIIHRALNQAERWGWIDRNVATLATSPRVGRGEVKSPSENQLRAIIDTMAKSNPQFGVAVVLAALTGA